MRHAKQAAVKAGYLVTIAENEATKLLQRADIWHQIERLDQMRQKRDLRQAVRSGLERLAFDSDDGMIAWLQGQTGEVSVPLDVFRISELKKSKGDTVELKFYNRFEAMSMLLQLADNGEDNDALQALCQALHAPSEEV